MNCARRWCNALQPIGSFNVEPAVHLNLNFPAGVQRYGGAQIADAWSINATVNERLRSDPTTASQLSTKRPFAPPVPRLLSDRPQGAVAGCYRCIALECRGIIDLNDVLTDVMIERITLERSIPCCARSPWRCTRPRRPL